MVGVDARREVWGDLEAEKKWGATPPDPAAEPRSPPYWTLDTNTDEWVQHQRDGAEICRVPTRRKNQDA